MRRSRGRALIVAAALAALTLGACGRDDFKNEPRPALPAEISVKIGDDKVVVSPSEFGAGLANFTVVNLAGAPTTLAVDGPTAFETDEIAPGTNLVYKIEITKGEYEAAAGSVPPAPDQFAVGADNPSGQNDLLLP
jgi:hypothetical protein